MTLNYLEPIVSRVAAEADTEIQAANAEMVTRLQGMTDPDAIRKLVEESTAKVAAATATKAGDTKPLLTAIAGEIHGMLWDWAVKNNSPVVKDKTISETCVRYNPNGELFLAPLATKLAGNGVKRTRNTKTIYKDWGTFDGRGHGIEIVAAPQGDSKLIGAKIAWSEVKNFPVIHKLIKDEATVKGRLMALEIAGFRCSPYTPSK